MVRASPKIVCVAGRLRRRGVESSISSSLFVNQLSACRIEEERGKGYIREVLCSFCTIDFNSLTRWSGRTSQTFSASMKASRTPFEGREFMYFRGWIDAYYYQQEILEGEQYGCGSPHHPELLAWDEHAGAG